jgi:tetratricopeptide (TPR) repeat protein
MQKISSKYRLNFITVSLLMMFVFVGCKSKQSAIMLPDVGSQTAEKPEVSRFSQKQQMAIDHAFLEGMKKMIIEDYGNALSIFFDVLKLDNQHAPANFQISQIRFIQNKLNDAEIYAERAWRLSPHNKFYLDHLAEIYQQNHKFPLAVQAYERLIKLDPRNEKDYQLEISALYLMMRRPMDALRILNNIEKQHGILQEVSLQKLKTFQALGQETNMRKELQKMIENFPNDPLFWAILVELNVQTGRFNEARENYEKILALDPENPAILATLAEFLQHEGRFEEARDMFRKAVEFDPSHYYAWEALLLSNLAILDSAGLLQDAEAALERFPEQPFVYYMLGTAYNLKKDYIMAMQYLEQAATLAFSNKRLLAQTYGDLGSVYHELENHRKSNENFVKALEIEPDNDVFLNNFAYFLSLRKENLNEAERMARFVAQRNPNNPTYLDTFAWVLYKQGKYTEARAIMELALKHGGNQEAILLEHFGDILWKLGEKEQALDYWKKAEILEYSGVSEFLHEKIRTQTLIEN